MAYVNLASRVATRAPFCTNTGTTTSKVTTRAADDAFTLPSIRSNNKLSDRIAALKLSSAHSRGFGDAELFHSFASISHSNTSPANLTVRAYTPEQAELVKSSWQVLKKDAGNHAHKFFLRVFEIAPSAAQLFSFLRDSPVPIEQNPHLKTHALIVFKLTGDAAAQLGEKGALDALRPKLVELGQSHILYGVLNEHFDVVKYSLLQTLQEALPNMWSPKLKAAWALAYDEIVDVIKLEMKAKKEATPAAVAFRSLD